MSVSRVGWRTRDDGNGAMRGRGANVPMKWGTMLTLATMVALTSCGPSKSSLDSTELLEAQIRDIGQDPPAWMLLAPGNLAYVHSLSGGVTCSNLAAFARYSESKDDTTAGCQKTEDDAWVRIHTIISVSKFKYIVAIATPDSKRTIGYIGAADLSPNIPAGTEAVVMNVANGTSHDPSQTTPELSDAHGNIIVELLDHTRVRVQQVFPDSVTTKVSVTVVSGEFRGRVGYVDIDDLNAITGDDDLTVYLGVERSK